MAAPAQCNDGAAPRATGGPGRRRMAELMRLQRDLIKMKIAIQIADRELTAPRSSPQLPESSLGRQPAESSPHPATSSPRAASSSIGPTASSQRPTSSSPEAGAGPAAPAPLPTTEALTTTEAMPATEAPAVAAVPAPGSSAAPAAPAPNAAAAAAPAAPPPAEVAHCGEARGEPGAPEAAQPSPPARDPLVQTTRDRIGLLRPSWNGLINNTKPVQTAGDPLRRSRAVRGGALTGGLYFPMTNKQVPRPPEPKWAAVRWAARVRSWWRS
eukprot:TRINITY_DN23468_c0_g5_i1.p1 TRINITY_DN23468_c0_g5~~TRINITY_DN23468_c0_g5_i1.p1  ORF type:complete len:270 (+),score=61.20 TRINITY_DN23468_c0_g5_i1:104-913(+)